MNRFMPTKSAQVSEVGVAEKPQLNNGNATGRSNFVSNSETRVRVRTLLSPEAMAIDV